MIAAKTPLAKGLDVVREELLSDLLEGLGRLQADRGDGLRDTTGRAEGAGRLRERDAASGVQRVLRETVHRRHGVAGDLLASDRVERQHGHATGHAGAGDDAAVLLHADVDVGGLELGREDVVVLDQFRRGRVVVEVVGRTERHDRAVVGEPGRALRREHVVDEAVAVRRVEDQVVGGGDLGLRPLQPTGSGGDLRATRGAGADAGEAGLGPCAALTGEAWSEPGFGSARFGR